MKKLISFAFLFFISASLYAQQPITSNTISYQGSIMEMDGTAVKDSIYPITVSIWTDATNGTRLWRDVFQTEVKGGIFNILLGSQIPLPAPALMDRPLWLGVSFNIDMETLPRFQIGTVPWAINVADSSITAKKMATDYVSAVTVNGTQVTSRGGTLNFASGNGVQFSFDSSSHSLYANIPPPPVALGDGGTDWSQIGNSGTNPDTNYLGTSDSVAFEIHVNNQGDTVTAGNGRVMRYEPMPGSPNIIGGYHGNVVSTTNGGSVIAGGGSSIYPNMINGDFSVVGGGAGNLAINGGTVAGGARDTAGEEAFVGGGAEDSAGYLAVVSGGLMNKARSYATVGGGTENKALGDDATVAGGATNTANGVYDAITGGTQNNSYDSASAIAGGVNNSAYSEGAVGGGFENQADTLSAIPGGYRLQLSKESFGFNAGNSGGETSVGDSDVAFLGNVNLWITNTDSVSRQLRFYSPNIDADYGDHSQAYTSFQYNGGATIHYKLPPIQGLLNTVLTNDGTGQLSWENPGFGSWLITGNNGTAPPTNFLGSTDSNSLELHIFDSGSSTYGDKRVMRYEINDTSANILGGYHDNAIIPLDTSLHSHIVGVVIAGGGASGQPNIVKGSYAVISGGRRNSDTVFAFVGGGDSNLATGAYSAVVGGTINLASGNSASVGGGSNNIASGQYSFVGGGDSNIAMGDHAVIAGGANDTAKATYSSIAGGDSNKVLPEANYAHIGGGFKNLIDTNAPYAGILSGEYNLIQSSGAAIVGGISDSIILDSLDRPSVNSFIGAGSGNKIGGTILMSNSSASDAAIVAGTDNYIGDSSSFIGAGSSNIITEQNDFIIAGDNNKVLSGSSGESGIGAGEFNTVNGSRSMIGAGEQNIIDTASATAFVGSGAYNYTNSTGAFVGAGSHNYVLSTEAGIASGTYNVIGLDGYASFIGAGSYDSARANSSFIGSGQNNITDTSNGAGDFANIPGGDHLISQSYAQTVIGFFNKRQGTSVENTNTIKPNPNDRVFIIGNGTDTGFFSTPVRSNAFEVSNNGHSIVYHTNGTGGATTGALPPFNGAIYGGRYQDNTCYAWGDVKGTDTSHGAGHGIDSVFSDFGVDSIEYKGHGDYRVYLSTVDPYMGRQVNFSHGFSVTATSVVLSAGVPNYIVSVTHLGYGIGGAANSFDVFLINPGNTPVDGEVMFHVFGRQ